MGVVIRRARIDDALLMARLNESIQTLHAKANPHIFKPYSLSDEMIEFFRARLLDASWAGLIGELDGIPVGYALLQTIRRPENPFTYTVDFLLVDQFSIQPEYQRVGYGRRLMEAAYQVAREQGIKNILLNVGSFNFQAIAFYEKLGFAIRDMRMELTLTD